MSQRGIDLLRLCSPACSCEEAREILQRHAADDAAARYQQQKTDEAFQLRKHRQNVEQHASRMLTRRLKKLKRAAVSDVRAKVYVPSRGEIAWTLMGRRVIR